MRNSTVRCPERFICALCILVPLLGLLPARAFAANTADAAQDAKPRLKMTCTLAPSSVFPGEAVVITGIVEGFPPDRALKALSFTWTGDAEITGSGNTATILAQHPGVMTIHGKAEQKSNPRKFGACDATLTVKPFDPPTMSCAASPAAVISGQNTTISAIGVSPQQRTLTYRYAASAGTISGGGPTVIYSSMGAPPGPIAILCTVVDDQGHSASATTSILVRLPLLAMPPPAHEELPLFPWPPPQASARVTLPMTPGTAGMKQMGDVDQRILTALDQMGYAERSHYWVPGGYALVTRVEQIDKNGRPKPMPYRFSGQLPPPDGIMSYFAGLFTSPPGYFRIIVFVVTNASFNDTSAPLGEADALRLLSAGPAMLPPGFASNPVPADTKITALIYEYQKSTADLTSPAVPIQSTVDAATHLQQAGLWQFFSTH